MSVALCALAGPVDARQSDAKKGGGVEASSCADLAQIADVVPCGISFSRYRRSDPRLDRIEAKGLAQSGMFDGKATTVHSVAELNRLSGRIGPGDRVVLGQGDWTSGAIAFRGEGTSDHPILITTESASIVLGGSATARFWGRNIVVQGLTFRGGTVDRDNFIVLELGGGLQRPCDACIVNRVTIDSYNSAPENRDEMKVLYLALQGRDITVANSRFLNLLNIGVMIHADHPMNGECSVDVVRQQQCSQRLLLIGNVASGVSPGDRRQSKFGKGKAVEIGSGQAAAEGAYSIIEGNLFENADAGTNTVSIKESNVIIRNNRFRANLGTLNLRSSNDVLIENNDFDGAGKPGMGGVLIQGSGHWIIGNRFRDLSAPFNDYLYPVSISTGAYEQLENNQKDYARAKQVVIADNDFIDVVQPPIMAGVYPLAARGRLLPPIGIYVIGNTFTFRNRRGGPGASAEIDPQTALLGTGVPDAAAGIHFSGNRIEEAGEGRRP